MPRAREASTRSALAPQSPATSARGARRRRTSRPHSRCRWLASPWPAAEGTTQTREPLCRPRIRSRADAPCLKPHRGRRTQPAAAVASAVRAAAVRCADRETPPGGKLEPQRRPLWFERRAASCNALCMLNISFALNRGRFQRRASGELTACSSADEAELLQPLPVRCDFQQSLHLWHRAFTTASSRRRPRASATHGDRADWGATSRSDRDGRATVARYARDGRATSATVERRSRDGRGFGADESAICRHRVGANAPPSRRYVATESAICRRIFRDHPPDENATIRATGVSPGDTRPSLAQRPRAIFPRATHEDLSSVSPGIAEWCPASRVKTLFSVCVAVRRGRVAPRRRRVATPSRRKLPFHGAG